MTPEPKYVKYLVSHAKNSKWNEGAILWTSLMTTSSGTQWLEDWVKLDKGSSQKQNRC